MRRLIALFGLMVFGGVALGGATLAAATAPPAFNGAYIIDDTSTGAVRSDMNALEDQVRSFADAHGVQLFVVYVDAFENPADPAAWGAATAEKNYLGDDGVLLSIAVQDRMFDLNAPEALIDDAQYTKITNEYVRPALKASDWSGVVERTLTGIDEAVLNPSSNGTGIAVAVIGGVVVVGAVAVGVTVARKRRKKTQPETADAPASLEELEATASSLLVQVDDDLRSSEQELSFAEAQFGAAAAEPFAAAITNAKEQLTAAFGRRQQLDDNVPDTDEDRRAWLTEIIDRCTAAKTSLDEHTASFTRLREVEQRAPETLAQLSSGHAATTEQLTVARQRAAELGATYAPTIVAQVQANLAEAAERLNFTAECIASADTELAAGKTSAAAVSLRAGEAALDQAKLLSASPETAAAELAESTAQYEAATADLRADLAVVSQLIDSAGEADRQALQQAAAQVSQLLERGTQGDPVSALAAAAAANVQIDAAIGSARENSERTRRTEAARDGALVAARAEVLNAEQFIATRRGAIGATARTRLSEAQRQLQLAEQLAQQDPARSYEAAQQAIQYARAASQLADNDVSGWGGGMGGGSGANSNLGTAVLGGVIGTLLSGGGGSGGGNSGSGGWSGSGGGFTGGWGGGGGRSGGGSRGSGGGGGRRGGGGRF
ncbi:MULTISPECIES: TPM domain-containing protein [unclassified Leucobacter]|uniref:TPM domain-containing protein n=1 Tax=unclassified Leucobacter TaxID=2621730 RepID=UPI00165E7FC7|nr:MULTISPECIES: TPM domain-containing protein [unclassified Leucobacter]